jgi:hypothetical protein
MKQFTMIAFTLAALGASAAFATDTPASAPVADPLFSTISALDGSVFDAFNHCSTSGQLQKHASYFASDVEFYHDTGGVTWTRDAMLANTAKYICGKVRRELVAGTLKVFPIKDYGAIEQGVHRFCQAGATECEGMADFVIVWRRQDMPLEGMQSQGTQWQITRVLSYGHRPNAAPR